MAGLFFDLGLLFLIGSSFVVDADEGCFDKARLEAKYNETFAKCKADFPVGTEARTMKIGLCLLKTHDMITKDLELNINDYRAEMNEVVLKHKEEIRAAVDKCWDERRGTKNAKLKLLQFFACTKVESNPYCPELDEWKQKNLQP